MSERDSKFSRAYDLHETFSARMKNAPEDTGSEVTVYINEHHRILGRSMPKGSAYSFSTHKDTRQERSWWLTPRGHTDALLPGMSVYFEAIGWAHPKNGSIVYDGQVVVHIPKGSEAASKAYTTQQSVDDGESTRKEDQRD